MRAHEMVLNWVEEALDAGRLALGDRMPAERVLAETLGVSRTSVREGIRILEAMGVVRSGVGSGPEAGTVIVAEPSSAIGAALKLHVATRHIPPAAIVDTRVMIESWAMHHADPASPALADAAELLAAMEDPAIDTERFHRLDAEFHVALTRASGNVVISAMMTSLRDSIHHYTLNLIENLPDWRETARRLRSEHAAILRAVTANRPAEAAELVTAHITGYYREAGLPAPPLPDR